MIKLIWFTVLMLLLTGCGRPGDNYFYSEVTVDCKPKPKKDKATPEPETEEPCSN